MSRKVTLPQLLKNFYAENSRFDAGPPVQILKELEHNVLVLADIEISDDDVPVLGRFFGHPQACKQIKRIHIDRSSSRKAHVRRADSAFTANNCKLLKELFKFISHAKSLQCVCFESLEIPMEALPLLGKALVASPSAISWLGFKDCDISADAGLRILTHYIGQLKLQVLAIEQCGLTDASLVYIASILKAQQNNLDSLYWNATLRVDPNQRGSLWNASEIDSVYRCGLVALSLFGNQFELKDVYVLTRVLRANHWLLGVNLANNNIHRDSVLVLVEELLGNTVLQALLLKNNPGLDRHIANVMLAAIHRNTQDTTSFSTRDVVEHLEIRHSSGARRLELQSPRIAMLLRTWQQLEVDECFAPQMPVLPSKHFGGGSTTSAATLGSTAKATTGRVGTKAATKKGGLGSPKEKAATPGTRRAAEAEIVAQLSRPQGYSAFDLVTDRVSSAPNSPRRSGSPSAARQGDRSFASFLSDSFASAGNGTSRHDTFNLPSPSLRREESDAKTAQFNVADFYQPSFQERASARQATRADSIGDSIQLSVDSLDGAGSSQQNTPRVSEDVLDKAIPVVSPVKNDAENVLRGGDSYYIGMDRNGGSDSKAQAKDSQRAHAEGVEDWGNVDWPVSDDIADHEGSGGRPPSRISIRRRGSGSTGARTPSPTQDMDAQHRALDEQYRRLLQQVKSTTRPPRHDSQGRMSMSSQELPRSSAPLRASFSGQSSSRPFPSNRPFYAGGSVPGASPPRPVASTITNAEMAALFGPGRGIARPATAPAYSAPRAAQPASGLSGTRNVRRSVKGKKQKSAAVKRTVLGKAHGPRGTRIRARSADQLEAQARSAGGEGRRAVSGSASKKASAAGAELAHELSSTVLNATRNLETVSAKLRDVIDTLSTSMDMNITMQRELLSASVLNTTAGGANTSRAAWGTPSAMGATTPLSYMKHPGYGPDSAAPSSGNRGGAAHRYREQSASPAPYSSHSGEFPSRGNRHHTDEAHVDDRGEHEDAPVGEADPELVDMVRARLGMKLRSMLVA